MVARLNNDSARFYAPYTRQHSVLQLPDTLPEFPAEVEPQGYSPLLAAAKSILRERLAIITEDLWNLDGEPASMKRIVDAANRVIRELGGLYLAYPGLRGRYQQSIPGMRIAGGV